MKEKYEIETNCVAKNSNLGTEYGSNYSDSPGGDTLDFNEIIKSKIEEDTIYKVTIIIENIEDE